MLFKLNEIYWNPKTKKLYNSLEDARNDLNEYGSTTPLVSDILNLLIKEYPLVCNNEYIKNELWGTQWISNESIPQLIKRTRVAIRDSEREVIENVKGTGYKINNLQVIDYKEKVLDAECEVIKDNVEKVKLKSDGNIKQKQFSIFLFSIFAFVFSMSSLIYCIEKHVFYELVPLSEIVEVKGFDFIKLSDNKYILKTKNQECEFNLTKKIARCKV
ncbi:transcriptional regulator [Aliivibrio finisterrensis]|uniref:Transcriptional regulator n=1 Tax=Aliivibrio finisterrensis TaxID=511998 RepID=A0A4Q5KKT9_9GAMM|nr:MULTISPECIES: winged helix-turn-helix domain-containing protein [Aliivibrio]MDD9175811.1 winged helix-turn-helix domain-containing protein [Aliivibrio sp. S3TY1]MDD9192935.1 winged helix-turn-helix domain-containing protein [Aliivibrio sp. S2TY2]RYU45937.1 transcriptional regulator [Aliivibrio finisterrensis]